MGSGGGFGAGMWRPLAIAVCSSSSSVRWMWLNRSVPSGRYRFGASAAGAASPLSFASFASFSALISSALFAYARAYRTDRGPRPLGGSGARGRVARATKAAGLEPRGGDRGYQGTPGHRTGASCFSTTWSSSDMTLDTDAGATLVAKALWRRKG